MNWLPRRAVVRPRPEALEDRRLMTCAAISGFVYNDVNNNGYRDAGEGPVAGGTLELRDVAGTVVATAVTDAAGRYEFSTDPNASTAPATRNVVVSYDPNRTGWTLSKDVAQFDPGLGTLTSVEIVHTARLTTGFQLENLDAEEGTISAGVNGTLTLSASGLDLGALNAQVSASETFTGDPYDGNPDFGGASGHDSGDKNPTVTRSVTLTSAADLARFTGTGNVALTARARSTSSTTGPGNLLAAITTTAASEVSIVYHYTPTNCLAPGSYTVAQRGQPAGYLDGRDARGLSVLPDSVGRDVIPVTLGTTDATNNNFGELRPSSLAGTVYTDLNKNGVREAGEAPIPGVAVTLTGADDLGRAVSLALGTDGAGAYRFADLRPGNYTISEAQPANMVPGLNSVGSLGGTAGGDQFFVAVAQGRAGENYDFGEFLPTSTPQVQPPPPVVSKVQLLGSTIRFRRRV